MCTVITSYIHVGHVLELVKIISRELPLLNVFSAHDEAVIDSQTNFGCNTHHRSRILISCAVGAIIIHASVCGLLKKMIEMT